MFIVYANSSKHSAWNTAEAAQNQLRVLVEHGYRRNTLSWDEIDCNYENGHYFV